MREEYVKQSIIFALVFLLLYHNYLYVLIQMTDVRPRYTRLIHANLTAKA